MPVDTADDYAVVQPTALSNDNAVVNGIRFADYKGFEKNWKLATVTFRTDSKEMRFSYANDLAYNTLLKGSTDYPKGATFIKVAMLTAGDPAFINSEVPGTVHRYQVMVYDKEKYPETDGWGYAIFASAKWGYSVIGWDGKISTDSIYDTPGKCHACHSLVKDRNYVFTRIAKLEPHKGADITPVGKAQSVEVAPRVYYKTMQRDDVPEVLRQFVPDNYSEVRRLQGDLAKYAFVGNVYELRMSFIVEALNSKLPVILYKEDGGSALIVAPTNRKQEPVAPNCDGDKQLFVSYWQIGSNLQNWPTKDLFCMNMAATPQLVDRKK